MHLNMLCNDFVSQKLDIPTRIGHTDSTQSWFVNPMGEKKPMPLWLMFVAVIPAFLIFLLLFLESQLTQWVFLVINGLHYTVYIIVLVIE